jgi:hypothetical protein
MTEAEKSRTAAIYLALLVFLFVVAAARLTYVRMARTPLGCDVSYVVPAILLMIGAFYTFRGNNPLVGSLFNALGLIHVAYTGSFESASLVLYTGRDFPLIDASLAAYDQALGFDWVAYLKWFDRHPFVSMLAERAYKSIFAQPLVIIVVLVLMRQTERMYGLIAMMVIALTVTSVMAVFLPSVGAYPFFQLTPADHPNISPVSQGEAVAPIMWMRDATFKSPMPPIVNGLIPFPSYHSATAVLYTWAAWRTPVLKWAVLALNIAMLLATPIHGSHYFVDVFAGAAVAVITIAATLWAFGRIAQMAPGALPAKPRTGYRVAEP